MTVTHDKQDRLHPVSRVWLFVVKTAMPSQFSAKQWPHGRMAARLKEKLHPTSFQPKDFFGPKGPQKDKKWQESDIVGY